MTYEADEAEVPVRGWLRPPGLLGHSARPRLVDVLRGPARQVFGFQAQLLAIHAADHVRRDAVVVAGELVPGHALKDPRLFTRGRLKNASHYIVPLISGNWRGSEILFNPVLRHFKEAMPANHCIAIRNYLV